MVKKTDIVPFLKGWNDNWLFRTADSMRRSVFGKDVYLRGVVEFSNWCSRPCLYCGLRSANGRLTRYRLEESEVIRCARLCSRMGIGTVVLQSGDDHHFGKEQIGEIIQEIKRQRNVAVTLSLGDRSREELRFWKRCGADRYLLKVETFHGPLHEKLRPGARLQERVRRMNYIRELGYETGSGIIIGLPGLTLADLAEDIRLLSEAELHMIAAGPFIPHPQTPLGKDKPGDILISFRTIALLRLLNPRANIPATSALACLDPGAQRKAISCGANVLMPSITPENVRSHYTIYPGKNRQHRAARGTDNLLQRDDPELRIRSVPLKRIFSREET